MKNFKKYLIAITLIVCSACDLEEDPPILSSTAFEDLGIVQASLDGVYGAFTGYNFLAEYLFTVNLFSGNLITRRLGQRNDSNFNRSITSLRPREFEFNNTISSWQVLYSNVASCNNLIEQVPERTNPSTNEEFGFNNALGQAYFLRAYSNFLLVRLWGQVPLRNELTSKETINLAVSTEKKIYEAIINDAIKASSLMNDIGNRSGYPKSYAANMLLSKVYMTLATAPADFKDSGITNQMYWQMAYDEAIKLYGKYSLNPDYNELFELAGDNTSESIFELQSNDATSRWALNFTPNNYINHGTRGWLSVQPKVYDDQVDAYGTEDPRLESTFLSNYEDRRNGNTINYYPSNNNNDRANSSFGDGFPFFFKFSEKTALIEGTGGTNTQNYIVYRYADLLLMLAEISNELQNGEELGYVTEVLDRVQLPLRPEYSAGQDSFRNAIMEEYRFELLGEGETGHNNRRRGFDYFLQHTILEHNNYDKFNAAIDVTMSENEEEVMTLPIPSVEINTNELIDN